MAARVTISLPDDLLARLDADAEAQARSRSELVQESIASYLGKTAEERELEARKKRAHEVIEALRKFRVGRQVRDDRPSLEILREIRETDDSAPMRDIRKGPHGEPRSGGHLG
jgi:predicted transcriptional regulator